MVSAVALVIGAPLAVDASLPDTAVSAAAQGRIGVYERVRFVEPGPSGPVVAGVIAPEGWRWMGGRTSGAFLSADGGNAITVGLRTGIADVDDLLREGVPAGAAAVDGATVTGPAGLDTTVMAYDLAAGDSPALRIVSCRSESAPTSCLTIDAVFNATDERGRDAAEVALQHVLDSAEVVA